MFKRFILAAAAALFISGAHAQTRSIDHPMTRAVIDAYTQLIKLNPTDYETYIQRAREYYSHDEYDLALADLTEALKHLPARNSGMRFDALMLRASTYIQTNRPQEALADLNSALAIDPESFTTLYLKANTEYTLGQYKEAKTDYQRLLRINPRSAEAMLGLARVAVKENNIGTANEYLDKAVAISPNNAEAYRRRASVRRLMGNDSGAVDDLVLALCINSSNPKAVEALLNYADSNYPAVISGLTSAIAQAPQNALFWYLRAQIAQAHNHYAAAARDYRKILDDRLYNYPGINASLAECEFSLGQYQTALDDVDRALTSITDNADYYILRSRILRALGRPDEAVQAAAKALAVKPAMPEALMQMARCYIDKKNFSEANSLLGEACLTNGNNPELLLLRASVLESLNQPQAAAAMRLNAGKIDGFAPEDVRSLKGFALEAAGEAAMAQAWMDNVLSSGTDPDGVANYYGACFYAARGDFDRAVKCAEESMNRGYANYFNWMLATDGPVNAAPLRDDLRFLNLVERNSALFKE